MAGALTLLKALVEPVRIRLYLLLRQSALTVSELSEILDISQSNTSHHVKALRDLGLLTADKTGQHTYYALDSARTQEKSVAAILANLETVGSELTELRSDAAKLRTVLAARGDDTFARWRMEQPDLPYTDIFAHLSCGRRGSVADIGCGEGDFFDALTLSFDRVVALDIDHHHALEAQKKNSAVRVLAADAQCLPFTDGAFDAVVLRMALAQIPEPAKALAEAVRITRPGGFISVIDTNNPAGGSFRESVMKHLAGIGGVRTDVERALPRLFMLRLLKL